VVDDGGRVVGVLSVEVVSHFLSSPEAIEQNTDPAARATL
jgi:hypothetical protein